MKLLCTFITLLLTLLMNENKFFIISLKVSSHNKLESELKSELESGLKSKSKFTSLPEQQTDYSYSPKNNKYFSSDNIPNRMPLNNMQSNPHISNKRYVDRLSKIRTKREIIIHRVFEQVPIISELLTICSIEKVGLVMDAYFIEKETLILERYITMLNVRPEYTRHSAKILLNLILCNWRTNKLRLILLEMMDGLCAGDKRSLLIFHEIVHTVIIDALMKVNFVYFNDIKARFNLLTMFNSMRFKFRPIVKTSFIDSKLKVIERLKEYFTLTIYNLDTEENIEFKLNHLTHEIPKLRVPDDSIPNKSGLYETSHVPYEQQLRMSMDEINKGMIQANANEVEKERISNESNEKIETGGVDTDKLSFNPSYNPSRTKKSTYNHDHYHGNSNGNGESNNINSHSKYIDPDHNTINKDHSRVRKINTKNARIVMEYVKNSTYIDEFSQFSFKQKEQQQNNSEKMQEDPTSNLAYFGINIDNIRNFHLNRTLFLKLSKIKEAMKNEYSEFLLNATSFFMPDIEDREIQVGVFRRSIYPRLRRHIRQLLKLNFLLDPFDITLPKGSIPIINQSRMKPGKKRYNINNSKYSNQDTNGNEEINNGNENNQNNINNFNKFKQITDNVRLKNRKKINNKSSFNVNYKKLFPSMHNNYRFKDLLFAKSSMNKLYKTVKSNKQFIPHHHKDIHLQHGSTKNSFKNHIPTKITINKINSDPKVQGLLNKPDTEVIMPQEIHSQYQINKPEVITVQVNSENINTKKMITDLLSEESYHDLMSQEQKGTNGDNTGLFNVLINIQNRKCSCGFICIEIGSIYGDFESMKPKNITVNDTNTQNVHLIIKPIIVMNNTKPDDDNKPDEPIPKPSMIIEEDCDDLDLSGNMNIIRDIKRPESTEKDKSIDSSLIQGDHRFKQIPIVPLPLTPIAKSVIDNCDYEGNTGNSTGIPMEIQGLGLNRKIQRKFYRKVSISDQIYSHDIFKQGLNLIIINRDKNYTKEFEHTFETNSNRKDSDALANILKDVTCNKIVVLTGIGKWLGEISPSLIKEIKQVGGPNLNLLFDNDEEDNTRQIMPLVLIGRKGLCRYNGVFKVIGFDFFKAEMTKVGFIADPNECFVEDVTLENARNLRIAKKQLFFHIVDISMILNLNKDNRFFYKAPTIATINPNKGSVHGGMEVKISGFNLGFHTIDIKMILIKNVVCSDFLVLSPHLLSCLTKASTIIGPGPGNVKIYMRNGLVSPERTCMHYEYLGDKIDAVEDLNRTIKKVQRMKDVPIYLNSNYRDNDYSLFDHLMFNTEHYQSKLTPNNDNRAKDKLNDLVGTNYDNMLRIVNHQQGTFLPVSRGMKRKRFNRVLNLLDSK